MSETTRVYWRISGGLPDADRKSGNRLKLLVAGRRLDRRYNAGGGGGGGVSNLLTRVSE